MANSEPRNSGVKTLTGVELAKMLHLNKSNLDSKYKLNQFMLRIYMLSDDMYGRSRFACLN